MQYKQNLAPAPIASSVRYPYKSVVMQSDAQSDHGGLTEGTPGTAGSEPAAHKPCLSSQFLQSPPPRS